MSRNPQPVERAGYSARCDTCHTTITTWNMSDAVDQAAQHNRVKHRGDAHAYPLYLVLSLSN